MAASPRIRQAEVMLGEQPCRFTLYCIPRRRHTHVLINDRGHLEVRAPWCFSLDEAKRAINEHGAWIEKQLERHAAKHRRRPQLIEGCLLPLLDERLELRLQNISQQRLFEPVGHPGAGEVLRRGQQLWVVLKTVQAHAHLPVLLEAWYRQQARDMLPGRMQPLARLLGVRYGKVSIRAQRTRWGSCGPNGTINLNWRLLLLPQAVCDYVLAHELCHLKEMNHSHRFWALVATIVPEYTSRRKELRELGQSLVL